MCSSAAAPALDAVVVPAAAARACHRIVCVRKHFKLLAVGGIDVDAPECGSAGAVCCKQFAAALVHAATTSPPAMLAETGLKVARVHVAWFCSAWLFEVCINDAIMHMRSQQCVLASMPRTKAAPTGCRPLICVRMYPLAVRRRRCGGIYATRGQRERVRSRVIVNCETSPRLAEPVHSAPRAKAYTLLHKSSA